MIYKVRAALIELLDLPEQIRGYGHMRERHAQATQKRRQELKGAILNRNVDAA
ncbi:hypothetical protein QO034_22470 [Sedimentitalea sp. JM2-8]|uniref:Transposase n=1 Tax=Sedimentitalea xiamensis TaxID=3050037 RepID=A0ABT7FL88_9RHOB|nr:DUF6537 domain-containing protein [Sedimentitalea xiamensis]MDK3075823.1 hypothetical protein [Sedimentitalea xiamensis]